MILHLLPSIYEEASRLYAMSNLPPLGQFAYTLSRSKKKHQLYVQTTLSEHVQCTHLSTVSTSHTSTIRSILNFIPYICNFTTFILRKPHITYTLIACPNISLQRRHFQTWKTIEQPSGILRPRRATNLNNSLHLNFPECRTLILEIFLTRVQRNFYLARRKPWTYTSKARSFANDDLRAVILLRAAND